MMMMIIILNITCLFFQETLLLNTSHKRRCLHRNDPLAYTKVPENKVGKEETAGNRYILISIRCIHRIQFVVLGPYLPNLLKNVLCLFLQDLLF